MSEIDTSQFHNKVQLLDNVSTALQHRRRARRELIISFDWIVKSPDGMDPLTFDAAEYRRLLRVTWIVVWASLYGEQGV